jgi:PAS domain S-box-containing protein
MSVLSSSYRSFVDFILAPKLATPYQVDEFRAVLAVKTLTILFVWSVGAAGAVGVWMGAWPLAGWTALGALICALTAFAMRLSDRLLWLGAGCGVGLAALWTGIAWVSGGLGSFTASWLVMAVFVGLVFGGWRLGGWMTVLVAALWAGLHLGAAPVAAGEAWIGPDQAANLRLVEVFALVFGLLSVGLLRQEFIEWLIITLRRVAAESNAFIQTVPVGLVSFDPNGEAVRGNTAMLELYGCADDRQALMHKTIDELLDGIDVHSFGREAEEISDGRRGQRDFELRRQAPDVMKVTATRVDGTTFLAEVAGAHLPDGGGLVVSLRDITDREAYEEELRRARDEALEASRAKSAFLANMSHELRTPLNAVIGYSEMLIDESEFAREAERADEPRLVDFMPDLQRIRTAGKHQLALIDDILDLSKIEAGKMDFHLETFEVDELIEDIAATIRPLAAKNHNELNVHIDDAVDRMRSDVTKLRQVLFNLLSNACKFTEEGTVSLSVRRDGDELVFAVSDDGIGMSQEQLARVFDAFTQADQSTTRKFGGTGLGLTIAQHFCRELGGDISVSSEPGQGTDFLVRLPVGAAAVESIDPSDDPTQSDKAQSDKRGDDLSERSDGFPEIEAPTTHLGDAVSSVHVELPADAPTVLVIDDDPAMRDLLVRMLRAGGFASATAATSAEGLLLADELKPAAITLDVKMPRVDGWQLLAELKQHPRLAAIPVIVISMISERARGHELGADDYLVKPIERQQLLDILRSHVGAGAGEPVN